jgi:4-cresol dehydrogenase (hydroxylating)
MPQRLNAALREWGRLLGPEAVVRGDDLTGYTANVTAFDRVVPAALHIERRDQLPDVVRIARDHGVPIYPISTGRNWGLGSRLPVRDGAVIVDLSRMNRILALDRATSTVVVEPGVTQGQLAEYLDREAPQLLANMTGSAADTSLVGNTVDRGIGYLAQRIDDLVGLEILLGTGQTLRTGEWSTSGEHHGPHWGHGIGPSIEGLFVQSNLGIVTAAALRLRQRPAATTAFRVSVPRDDDIVGLLEALAGLHRDSVLTMPTRIFDGVWTHGSLDGPEPAWTAFGGLSGRPGVVEALRHEVHETLDPLGTLELVSLQEVRSTPVSTSESSWWRSVLSVMGGHPTDLSVTNWASRIGVAFAAEDLDASDFGMLCDVRAIPFAGGSAHEAAKLARGICAPHSLQPCISLSALDAHTLEAVFILLFNRSAPEQVDCAHACAVELGKALTAADLVPHRIGVEDMATAVAPQDPYWETLASIKRSLDPTLIIAPGRYSVV